MKIIAEVVGGGFEDVDFIGHPPKEPERGKRLPVPGLPQPHLKQPVAEALARVAVVGQQRVGEVPAHEHGGVVAHVFAPVGPRLGQLGHGHVEQAVAGMQALAGVVARLKRWVDDVAPGIKEAPPLGQLGGIDGGVEFLGPLQAPIGVAHRALGPAGGQGAGSQQGNEDNNSDY